MRILNHFQQKKNKKEKELNPGLVFAPVRTFAPVVSERKIDNDSFTNTAAPVFGLPAAVFFKPSADCFAPLRKTIDFMRRINIGSLNRYDFIFKRHVSVFLIESSGTIHVSLTEIIVIPDG